MKIAARNLIKAIKNVNIVALSVGIKQITKIKCGLKLNGRLGKETSPCKSTLGGDNVKKLVKGLASLTISGLTIGIIIGVIAFAWEKLVKGLASLTISGLTISGLTIGIIIGVIAFAWAYLSFS